MTAGGIKNVVVKSRDKSAHLRSYEAEKIEREETVVLGHQCSTGVTAGDHDREARRASACQSCERAKGGYVPAPERAQQGQAEQHGDHEKHVATDRHGQGQQRNEPEDDTRRAVGSAGQEIEPKSDQDQEMAEQLDMAEGEPPDRAE